MRRPLAALALAVAALIAGVILMRSGGGDTEKRVPATERVPVSDSVPVALRCDSPPTREQLSCVQGLLVAQLGSREGLNRWIALSPEPSVGIFVCQTQASSEPPLCGGEAVRVEGLEVSTVAGVEIRRLYGATRAWTDDEITVVGVYRDRVLTVPADGR